MISEHAHQVIRDAQNRSVSRANPKLKDLPSWMEGFRPHQIIAVKRVLAAFEDHNVVVLDAPTGTGKTLIAETVRRMMGARALYVCNSKQLQDQFAGDYDYAEVLKGRNNYTPQREVWDATCADCRGTDCTMCEGYESCPYQVAKTRALGSDLAVVNTAYALHEWNGMGTKFSGRGLVIADEADTLEQELMRYVSVDISRGRCARYGLKEPQKVTVAASWREWIEYAIPTLTRRRAKISNVGSDDLRSTRERAYLTRLITRLRQIEPQIEDGWIYTGKNGGISFKPVHVDSVGKTSLWKHGRKWLLMSATIVSAGSLLENLGWAEGYSAISVGSVFSPSNRRVKIIPAANMSRKANESQTLVRTLFPILARHRRERVLVHCVSYQLAEYLHGELVRRCGAIGMGCSTYSGSDGKAGALAEFRSAEGHVLIAPSLDRGVDLPDEECRVIVIAKIPYPNLGDRQVSARLHSRGGQVWYNVQTVRSIVQMTGRGVRHADDWCVGYVLDSQFRALWSRSRGLFPRWWTEALEWNG